MSGVRLATGHLLRSVSLRYRRRDRREGIPASPPTAKYEALVPGHTKRLPSYRGELRRNEQVTKLEAILFLSRTP